MASENKLTLVTGGARSGKSSFGETLMGEKCQKVLYIATAEILDDEMKERVRKHREDRLEGWLTLEAYKFFDKHLSTYQGKVEGVFVDCITLMVTRLMMDFWKDDWESISSEAVNKVEKNIMNEVDGLITGLMKLNMPAIIITNEVGNGIVPQNRMAREFRDIAGRINQQIAHASQEVYWVVSGIPVKIKS